MKKLKRYQKYVRAFNALLALYVGSSFLVEKRVEKGIRPWVESHLEEVMERQEERLGIEHFGVPRISHESPPWGRTGNHTQGGYDRKTDTIFINPGHAAAPGTPRWVRAVYSFGDIKEILNHELGHFYCDKLAESLGEEDWGHLSEGKLQDYQIGPKLVSEGIAEYFERIMSGKGDSFKDSDWPQSLGKLKKLHQIYDGGFHLVKPIIDRYGNKGIEYLVLNPPGVDDLGDLPGYQSRVLDSLSREF